MPKYRNARSVAHDGRVFASKKECNRYEELLLLVKMRKISELSTQTRYELIPKQDGERPCHYVADFVYRDAEGKTHCEDTKGFRTKEYVIKRKLMLWVHNIRIEEI